MAPFQRVLDQCWGCVGGEWGREGERGVPILNLKKKSRKRGKKRGQEGKENQNGAITRVEDEA